MRTRLLAALINYCAGHLADLAAHPYKDPATQESMAKIYRETIERATRHMRGYHEKHRGTCMATWVRVIDTAKPNWLNTALYG